MEEPGTAGHLADEGLFLIEIEPGDHARYVVAQSFLAIEPGHGAMGVPWADLALLFRERALRAVPVPGRRLHRDLAQSTGDPGQSTDGGRFGNVEINFNAGAR